MQKVMVAMAVTLLVAVDGATGTAADMKSGLQPGDFAGAFNVKDITGPNAGKTLCYR